jgi:hypothetical protein
MAFWKLLTAPIRRIVNFPLFQLALTIAVILLMQTADTKSFFGQIFNGLDWLVEQTVRLVAATIEIRSFTRAWLTTGFMIAYVYLAGLAILWLIRLVIGRIVELVARNNTFGLTNTIARERGVAAYRAWVPLERIRPPDIPQPVWEERYAWPADNSPPYPPLANRIVRGAALYLFVGLLIAGALQLLTPFPVLSWIGRWVGLR